MTEPRRDERPDRNDRIRFSPKVVLWTVVAVFALILIAQNRDDARVDILFWNLTAGLWLLLLGAFLLGMLLGWLLPKVLRRDRADRGED